MSRPARRIACTALLALAPLACWPGAGDITDFDLDFCKGVNGARVFPQSATLRLGDTIHVEAMGLVRGEPAFLCSGSSWSSSDVATATVTVDGVVTAVGRGTAWIRGGVEGFRDSTLVTVSTATLATLVIDSESATLLVGQVMPLRYTARDSAGNVLPVRRVSWRSANTAVARVSTAGNVVAVAPGSANIEVSAEGRTTTLTLATSRDAPSTTFTDIAAGDHHACGLVGGAGLAEGTAYCWGMGHTGRLGTGDDADRIGPSRVASSASFEHVAVAIEHSCANTAAGAVYCWGSNRLRQLGDGTMIGRNVPVRVNSTVPLRSVVASGDASCALAANGTAYCWGSWANRAPLAPTAVGGTLTFTSLAAGTALICGLTVEGRVYCWGMFGTRSLPSPTLVSGEVRFRTIDVAYMSLCGVAVDRRLYCWGQGHGSFWDPSVGRRDAPWLMSGGADFATLAVGSGSVCALTTASALWCLGMIHEDVGTPDPWALRPVARGANHAFAMVDAGGSLACAIDVVGGGWCWGRNSEGQVGVPLDIGTTWPVQLRVR